MADDQSQWVVRSEGDKVKGPYTTEVLKNMIINGAFSGNEEVCAYPQGEWQALTRQPEFYDALLESLENPQEVNEKRTEQMQAETVVRPAKPVEKPKPAEPESIPEPLDISTPEKNSPPNSPFDLKSFVDEQIQKEAEKKEISRVGFPAPQSKSKNLAKNNLTVLNAPLPAQGHSPLGQEERNKAFDIQLTDIKKLKQEEIKKILPYIVIVLIVIFGIGYYFFPSDGDLRSGWVLIGPTKKTKPISAADVKEAKKEAIEAMQSGLYEKILKSQQKLVTAIEGSPKDLEAMGLLCMAQQQIWNFSKQTVQDFKSIGQVMQLARSVNPISKYSETCQAVYLIAKGQGKEALSLIERTLDIETEEKFTIGVYLYFLKAEILENDLSFINSEAYYDQASQLWPQWNLARFGLARVQYKQKKFSEARQNFLIMYNSDKSLKSALFGLGLMELKGSNNSDKAADYFASGFKLKQQLPKDFLTESLLTYAQLLLDSNENSKALDVAEEGFKASPSHRGLKELVSSLGGDITIENAPAEIVLMGKQFALTGNHMVAQAQFKAAFELDPKNATAAYLAAKSLWQINQTRDAISWLEKSIAVDPKMVQAYVLKADYESQKYNFSAAAKTLGQASKLFPQNHEVLKAQALMEFRRNNVAAAIQYGERAVKIYNADVELLSLLAQAHIGYYVNAPSTNKADIDKKDLSKEAARKYSARAVDLEPAWPEAQITYAKYLEAIEGTMRAEFYLKEVIKAYPYSIEYRLALADFYKANEKYSEAAKIYEEVVNIDSKNKKGNFGLADTYRILNKTDLAQRYFNQASVLDPTDVEPIFSNAKLLIDTALGNELKPKIGQALAKLELVKKINPEYPKVSYMMAKCFMELGDFVKASELVKEEKSKNPNIADSYILAA
ncbi:MAG: tetratricopeptide repeat protein, partial [Bacteriovoracia bacterium]